MVSKTEREMSSQDTFDALDETFDDDADEIDLEVADLELADDHDDDDETAEHPVISRDATGEYALPDTVPVVPHDGADDRRSNGRRDTDRRTSRKKKKKQNKNKPATIVGRTENSDLDDGVEIDIDAEFDAETDIDIDAEFAQTFESGDESDDDSSDTEADQAVDDLDADLDDADLDDDDIEAENKADEVDADDDEADEAEARDGEFDDDPDADDDVSNDILEELRRADIDGPVVALAPQDDSAAVRRRPRRAADYDPAPVPIPARVPRVLGRKPRVRKVTRVVRHVDPWSVFKIAIVAHIVLYIIVLTASVLLWNVANATGTVQNVERFFESFGWNSFEFNGGELYHAGWVAGLFVVIGFTGLAVLAATLFNLITDLVGGVRFTVLEEEVVETRTSPMRRFVVRRAEPEVPAVIDAPGGAIIREAVVDDTGAIDRPTR